MLLDWVSPSVQATYAANGAMLPAPGTKFDGKLLKNLRGNVELIMGMMLVRFNSVTDSYFGGTVRNLFGEEAWTDAAVFQPSLRSGGYGSTCQANGLPTPVKCTGYKDFGDGVCALYDTGWCFSVATCDGIGVGRRLPNPFVLKKSYITQLQDVVNRLFWVKGIPLVERNFSFTPVVYTWDLLNAQAIPFDSNNALKVSHVQQVITLCEELIGLLLELLDTDNQFSIVNKTATFDGFTGHAELDVINSIVQQLVDATAWLSVASYLTDQALTDAESKFEMACLLDLRSVISTAAFVAATALVAEAVVNGGNDIDVANKFGEREFVSGVGSMQLVNRLGQLTDYLGNFAMQLATKVAGHQWVIAVADLIEVDKVGQQPQPGTVEQVMSLVSKTGVTQQYLANMHVELADRMGVETPILAKHVTELVDAVLTYAMPTGVADLLQVSKVVVEEILASQHTSVANKLGQLIQVTGIVVSLVNKLGSAPPITASQVTELADKLRMYQSFDGKALVSLANELDDYLPANVVQYLTTADKLVSYLTLDAKALAQLADKLKTLDHSLKATNARVIITGTATVIGD